MIRWVLMGVVVFVFQGHASAMECADFGTWLEKGCRHVVDTYNEGDDALLVSGYEWHLPYSWTPEKRAEENENAWGVGWARSREHADYTENVFFLVFEDSHKTAQFNVGYTWMTYWGDRAGLQGGLGFSAAIVQRPDIADGWPVPVVLPMGSLRYQKVEIMSSYVPKLNGGVNHGSILYIFGKINLK